ncbi:MAG: DUF882 domain-containing protein [Parvibaculum sp.]|jgi:uncharacterized protein YcbK (DUF882 family)|uniref:DUF882 domain-containing protein n=1 Tax=Parvibaculum sp. TaxID=2024848 RepID=UPI00283D8381|nr:DUF882 domain-containing protein [Parvibaculum sp.]MDR3500290.1 DUF882 domain-containing protein [Parvibaculum sp.]
MKKSPHTGSLTRRTALTLAATGAALVAAPAILKADAPYKRSLRMQSLNSGEALNITYWADGDYIPDALKRINWFMRDLRTGERTEMDVRLLDLLWEIDQLTPSNDPLYTMSGYRSESTNAWLAAHSDGVDPSSFHMRGMAMDLTQDFSDPGMIYRVAKKLGKGGAGFYPVKHPFVHVDVGPPDSWVYPDHGDPTRAEKYDAEHPVSKG